MLRTIIVYVSSQMMFYFYYRFKEGLSTLGVLEAVQNNAEAMREAFVFSPALLDACTLETILPITKWSTTGSNRYNKEKRTQSHWRDFLVDLEGTT